MIKNTSNETAADVNGYYIMIAPFDAILSGRYTGFNTIDILVNGQSTLDINMKTSSSALGEIVVTGHGY